jgi:hypothetical protein
MRRAVCRGALTAPFSLLATPRRGVSERDYVPRSGAGKRSRRQLREPMAAISPQAATVVVLILGGVFIVAYCNSEKSAKPKALSKAFFEEQSSGRQRLDVKGFNESYEPRK